MGRGYVILRTQSCRANLHIIHVLLCVVISTEAHDAWVGQFWFLLAVCKRVNGVTLLLPLEFSTELSLCPVCVLCSHKANPLGKCSEFCGEPIACRNKKWGEYTTIDGKPGLGRDCGDTEGLEGDPQVQRQRSLIPWLGVGIWVVNHRHDWLLSLHSVSWWSFWRQTAGLNRQWSVLVGLYFMLMLDKGIFFLLSQCIDKSYTRMF